MIDLLFFGSPDFVNPILKRLANDAQIRIIGVVTQPDRPVGRKKVMTPTPVKVLSNRLGLPVLTPKEYDEGFFWDIDKLARKNPKTAEESNKQLQKPVIDLAVLAAYGKILPDRLLSLPKYGFINLHPSLLPLYRGASPTVGTILNGDFETGMTIMQMDEALDHGPIVAQFKSAINKNDNSRTLVERLFEEAAVIFPEVIEKYISWLSKVEAGSGTKLGSNSPLRLRSAPLSEKTKLFLPPKEQDDDQATFTKILKKEDGFVPWDVFQAAMHPENSKLKIQNSKLLERFSKKIRPLLSEYKLPDELPLLLNNFIRAMAPWPGAWTTINLKSQNSKLKNKEPVLKILKAHVGNIPQENESIKTLKQDISKLETRNWKLVLDEVRLEGKATMKWEEFEKGYLK